MSRALTGAALAAALLAGCGDDGADDERLVVSAAASLTEALRDCSRSFAADVRVQFAGSDELAAQIRQGAQVDVFLAANTKLPEQLADEGRLAPPVVFATNDLVVAAHPASGIDAVADLADPDVDVVIGSPSVPVGAYTREVIGRLPERLERAILANVRSEEPDVKGVVGKLTQGAAQAGFTYASDVDTQRGRLTAVELPARLQPTVAYGGGVVRSTERWALAGRFLADVRGGRCATALRARGFGPPP